MIYIGDSVTNQMSFYKNDVLTDPSAVVYKIYKDGTLVATYNYGVNAELVKASTGVYYVDWTTVAAGFYQWVMAGTGTVIARQWDSFSCVPDPV